MNINTINKIRIIGAMLAEMIDNFRIVPRLCLLGYGYILYNVVIWYMAIKNHGVEDTAFVTGVIGVSSIVIGLYQSSGRNFADYEFKTWSIRLLETAKSVKEITEANLKDH